MENPVGIHDLGGPPLFVETPICLYTIYQYYILPSLKLTFSALFTWLQKDFSPSEPFLG